MLFLFTYSRDWSRPASLAFKQGFMTPKGLAWGGEGETGGKKGCKRLCFFLAPYFRLVAIRNRANPMFTTAFSNVVRRAAQRSTYSSATYPSAMCVPSQLMKREREKKEASRYGNPLWVHARAVEEGVVSLSSFVTVTSPDPDFSFENPHHGGLNAAPRKRKKEGSLSKIPTATSECERRVWGVRRARRKAKNSQPTDIITRATSLKSRFGFPSVLARIVHENCHHVVALED